MVCGISWLVENRLNQVENRLTAVENRVNKFESSAHICITWRYPQVGDDDCQGDPFEQHITRQINLSQTTFTICVVFARTILKMTRKSLEKLNLTSDCPMPVYRHSALD